MRYILCCIGLLTFTVVCLAQDFSLDRFTDPGKYQWETLEKRQQAQNDLIARQKLLQIYQLNRLNVATNLSRSAVIPGWGQFSAKSYTKGQVILAMEVVTLGSSLYFYDQAMDSYSKYKNASNIGDINQYYNDAQRPYRFSQAFLGAAVLIWGYSLFDTYQETEKYNGKLWNRIVEESTRTSLQITPTGVSWRF